MVAATTIAAIATPPGRGGVGMVRLSGPQALAIAQQITHLPHFKPRFASYVSFYALDGTVIDQGIVLYFKGPHSFTGEDVVEFHAHGSPLVLDELVKELLRCGAELAKPGEFSLRAFLNDKIDLVQAEAIADLIQANSLSAARMAMRSLQGEFSKQIAGVNERLIQLRLYVEAALDFPEEDLEFLQAGKVAERLQEIQQELAQIRAIAAQGAIIREGLSVVIAGRPNAGKSTLMNALAQRDVAIVTPVAGTTRDVMHEHLLLDDIPVHLIDTAGLRDSSDVVEQEGIKRAWQEVKQADCVLLLMDSTLEDHHEELILKIKSSICVQIPIILVYNKVDKLGLQPKKEGDALYVSLKNGEGLGLIKDEIKAVVGFQPQEGQFLARRRHLEALDQAMQLVAQAVTGLSSHQAGELLAEDLRLAHAALGAITGEFSADDLLGVIFSSFCIGK